ncbi:uncharacterized protein Smp_201660 [Schistosoma mansoni]|uniref:uncharacterized protein n=1 Tax=Schistosoma mansoni TaxID=6183 RepID=UPI00022DC55B|nr:uncharacterized protein Smp_201660 [Schistosoma mansoni]|eukprot:XP_018650640.1 uncharacterized protein Smp_201660 [Schistosoma mansoni]
MDIRFMIHNSPGDTTPPLFEKSGVDIRILNFLGFTLPHERLLDPHIAKLLLMRYVCHI